MFDIGGGELLLIFLAVLLLFGPKKIPEIAQMLGKGMQQIRKAQSQFRSQMDDIQYEIKKSVESNMTVENVSHNNMAIVEESNSTVLPEEIALESKSDSNAENLKNLKDKIVTSNSN